MQSLLGQSKNTVEGEGMTCCVICTLRKDPLNELFSDGCPALSLIVLVVVLNDRVSNS